MIERAVEAILAGQPVILPTDTVYGLCTTAASAAAVEALYRLKGRPGTQPTAILTGDEPRVLREGAGPFEPSSILRRNPGEELAPWP